MEHFVQFEDVSKYYQTGSVRIAAADHLNFYVDKGEFCIIVGPSGAGKTTLLNILGGMDTCDEGHVWLDGQDVNGGEGVKDPACLAMTTESLTREFPLYTPSLLNLVKTSETHVKGLSPQE